MRLNVHIMKVIVLLKIMRFLLITSEGEVQATKSEFVIGFSIKKQLFKKYFLKNKQWY